MLYKILSQRLIRISIYLVWFGLFVRAAHVDSFLYMLYRHVLFSVVVILI